MEAKVKDKMHGAQNPLRRQHILRNTKGCPRDRSAWVELWMSGEQIGYMLLLEKR
jgi:hypothetical protein